MSIVAITGAGGFIGRSVAARLLPGGHQIVNLTGHVRRPLVGSGWLRIEPLAFDEPGRLEAALRGVEVLVSTYWIRFEHGSITFDLAVRNTERLLHAARTAGVRRVVEVSVLNPSSTSALAYYRGKARVEELVRDAGMSWAIVRPSVVYGPGDILINNLAWTLRRVPAFGVPGDGSYPLQPVFVDDLAALLARRTLGTEQSVTDAVGPERYTFEELVRLVRWVVGSHAVMVHLPPSLALAGSRLIGAVMRDVMLTSDEVQSLMDGLLASDAEPVGRTSLAQWLVHHREQVGARYASELERHYRPQAA